MPVEGILQRLKTSVRYALTGNADWFGPGQPVAPGAPKEVEGRQWQMPISSNALIQTKVEGVSFRTLRMMADTTDIIRLLIEERKDQLCALDWAVQKKGEALRARGNPTADATSKRVSDFLQSPDQQHPWHQWLRYLLEDMYVIDAASLYVQRTKGGKLYALRPIDGSTIKRIIDGHGWTPQPPLPAYQQILNGIAATDYTTDNLIYLARNMRTNRIYGLSHVEQIIVTARTWLARQASNLEYYDKGSVPDGFLSASKDWGAQEIARYQELFDLQLSGQLGERRKIKITPNDSKFIATKEPALKSDYDEWLVRIACFCFSVPPIPFIREMARATADQSASQSQSGGLEYDRRWLERTMTQIIGTQLDAPEYEFVFRDRESQDPLERAQIDQVYLQTGVLQANEVRSDLGLAPLSEPDEPATPQGNQQAASGQDDEKKKPVAKRAQHSHKLDDSPLTPDMVRVKDAFVVALGEVRDSAVREAEGVGKAAGGDGGRPPVPKKNDDWWLTLADRLDLSGLSLAYDDYSDTVVAVTNDGARHEVARLLVNDPQAQAAADAAAFDMFDVKDPNAIAWANEHVADMLTSDGTGGKLADSTRDMIRKTIARIIDESEDEEAIVTALNGAYAFSTQRAELIARTELRDAQAMGALIGAKAVGMEQKRWLLSNDEGVCPVCEANAAQDWISISNAFQSGDEAPLAHPNCRCDAAYRRKPKED